MSVESYVQGLAKPKCACTFNGTYLEDVVPGYRTSYVEGRDSYDSDLEELTSKRIHGARYRSMKEKTRDLKIHFNLHADNEENYQKRCNAIRGFLLQNRQVKIIFNDESDVYYIGSAKNLSFSKFVNAYNSTCVMTIHCSTPFKYSVQTYVMMPNADPETEGGTDYTSFVLDYDGTWRSYPTFEVDFYSTLNDDTVDGDDKAGNFNGDCGFVAFTNQNGRILQFGNPKETSTGENVGDTTASTSKTISEALINQVFKKTNTLYGWTLNGALWNANPAGPVRYVTTSTMADGRNKDLKSGSAAVAAYGKKFAMQPTSYGSQTGYHYFGPYLTRKLGVDSEGNRGAVNWTVQCKHVIAAAESGTRKSKSRGAFEIAIHNQTKVIAAVSIMKNHSSTQFTVHLIVNGKSVETITIDGSHESKLYGFGKKANRTTTIKKNGSKVTFNIAGTTKTYKVDAIKDTVATYCQMAFHVRENDRPQIEDNAVFSFKFVKNGIIKTTLNENGSDNTFTTNDKLTIDCNDAYIYLGKQENAQYSENVAYNVGDMIIYNGILYECIEATSGGAFDNSKWEVVMTDDDNSLGELTPELGALGNDWETFYLEPGINQIHFAYSDWVSNAYKPTPILKYKKVYI